mmetsp:Transcript_6797/g.11439  ORF Transcript_6797/g.11439 Transcript_6797/m.11439 type:complete len:123 (-) Transcript_6797:803-1171(-)
MNAKREGHFKDESIERISFFTGKAEAIQSGGYNCKGSSFNQFGIDLSQNLFGTNNYFGIPFEVVVNLDPLQSDTSPTEQLLAHKFESLEELASEMMKFKQLGSQSQLIILKTLEEKAGFHTI